MLSRDSRWLMKTPITIRVSHFTNLLDAVIDFTHLSLLLDLYSTVVFQSKANERPKSWMETTAKSPPIIRTSYSSEILSSKNGNADENDNLAFVVQEEIAPGIADSFKLV